jgi:hypothetical protein
MTKAAATTASADGSASTHPDMVWSDEDDEEQERRTKSQVAMERECVRNHVPIGTDHGEHAGGAGPTVDDTATAMHAVRSYADEVPTGSENDHSEDAWATDDPAAEVPFHEMGCGSEVGAHPEDECC